MKDQNKKPRERLILALDIMIEAFLRDPRSTDETEDVDVSPKASDRSDPPSNKGKARRPK
jgi:hypothetical protein